MIQPKACVTFTSALLVLLFAYTGISKLSDFSEFSSQMHNQPIPAWLSQLATWILPPVELLIAALLATHKFRMVGFTMAFVMLATFTVYIALIITSAFPYIPCSCAGIFKRMSWNAHLGINALFMIMAYVGYRAQQRLVT
jgi:putative oxidoreductase